MPAPHARSITLPILIFYALLISNVELALSTEAFPATLEIDLVFPVNGTTYKRAYPFPVVFAVQGAAAAWPHGLHLSWDLASETGELDHGALPRHLPGQGSLWTSGDVPGGQDPFMFISSADAVRNSTARSYVLRWDTIFKENCTFDGRRTVGPFDRFHETGFIRLTMDNELGVDPTVASRVGQCPANATTARMVGRSGECIILDEADLYPAPNPCAVQVSPELAANVTQSMLESARCTTGTWPDPTLVAPCNHNMSRPKEPPSSAASPRGEVGVAALVLLLVESLGIWLLVS